MLKDKEIIQQKDNDKINHNDIQTCNKTILNCLKRLIFFFFQMHVLHNFIENSCYKFFKENIYQI